ncbi:MAG: ankyrin repeat domain-containing protein [Rickettsiales bacterium]|nr:ankyrin repeat domain-containing protein [Rickettsiales bacterium]
MAPKNLPKDYKPYQKKVYREYLHDAIKNDDNEDIQRLLYCGVDLELQDDTGKTALQVAAELDKEEIVKELLSHGADRDKNNSYINILYRELQSNQKVYYGNPNFVIGTYALNYPIKIQKNGKLYEQPLLLYAIENQDFHLLDRMLKLKPDMTIEDSKGDNIFDYLKKLIQDLKKQKINTRVQSQFNQAIDKIYKLLKSQLDKAMLSYNRTEITNLTHILMLAKSDNFDKTLSEYQKEISATENQGRFSKILTEAKLIKSTFHYKVHGNIIKKHVDEDGRTLLHLAAIFDDPDLNLIEKYHFDKHDAFITNNDEDTALHIAVTHGNIKAAEALLEKFPKILNEKNSNDERALDIAINKNKIEIVNLIFANSGLKFEEINTSPEGQTELKTKAESAVDTSTPKVESVVVAFTEGDTPLHLAVKLGNIEAIKNIMQYYTDIAKLENQDGKTALDLALDNQQTEVVYAILENTELDSNLYSDINNEKISKLKEIKEKTSKLKEINSAYQFVQENDPPTFSSDAFSSLDYQSKHLACCIAVLQEKEDLLLEIQKISPDIMSKRHDYVLNKGISMI